MFADVPFMPWIDHLPEIGDPIRRDRAKLCELASEAAELERHALALRAQVQAGQVELLTKTMRHWTLADIQTAAEAANRSNPMASAKAKVADATLRGRLELLDGWHLAAEALQTFELAGVICQHNLLSTASDEERRQTLARVMDWWNHAGRPVCERLAMAVK